MIARAADVYVKRWKQLCRWPEAHRMSSSGKWQFFIDRGGTFTDIVARAPDGRLLTRKLLSENPEAYDDAAIAGIADLIGCPRGRPLPCASDRQRQNGNDRRHQCAARAQRRSRAADRQPRLPRCARDRLSGAAQDLRRARSRSPRCSMPAWPRCRSACAPTAPSRRRSISTRRGRRSKPRVPTASRRSPSSSCMLTPIRRTSARRRALAREAGFTQISASHEVSPLVKFVGRGDTAVVDAYLSPLLRRYVDRVAKALVPTAGRADRSSAREGVPGSCSCSPRAG